MPQILVVEDEQAIRWKLRCGIEEAGLGEVSEASDLATARELTRTHRYDLVLLDLGLPLGANEPIPEPDAGFSLLAELTADAEWTPAILVVTADSSIDTAVRAMRCGAADYLQKPFDPLELRQRVGNIIQARRGALELTALREVVERISGIKSVIHQSEAMARILDHVRRVGQRDSTVLVRGETGTGKELIARAIHFCSPRRAAPFVAVDTPAIPAMLLEDELFGHVRGAFTGAAVSRHGKFEMAEGGTIFFDEIGDMDLQLQAKMLRVIQEREFQPVGGSRTIKADVRIVAATNQDLESAVREGRFREDLYYRLNVFPLTLPPLRERREDIPVLANHFVIEMNREFGTRVGGFAPRTLERLQALPWPGNVRQLRNLVERLVTLAEDDAAIGLEDLEAALAASPGGLQGSSGATAGVTPAAAGTVDAGEGTAGRIEEQFPDLDGTLAESIEILERILIKRALVRANGNKSKAATLLGLSRPALYNRLARYDIG
jgi:DNA-binding NtrC family response regulator